MRECDGGPYGPDPSRPYERCPVPHWGSQAPRNIPDNDRPDREDDALHDDAAYKAARTKNSYKIYGAAKAPNMGRPGRATGGRINRADGGALEAGGNKLSGQLIRTLRTPKEAHDDRLNEDGKLGVLMDDRPTRAKGGRLGRGSGGRSEEKDYNGLDVPSTAPETTKPTALGRNKGGRTRRSMGGSATAKDEYTQAGRTYDNEDASGKDRWTGGDYPPSRANGGRTNRAGGGWLPDRHAECWRRSIAHSAAEDYRTGPDY